MVGVPTSKGCKTCLTRAVKCDEAQPGCGQCRRGGRRCPGYARAAKFVDEGPRLARQRPRKQPPRTTQGLKASALRIQRQPGIVKLEQYQLLSSFISTMFPLASSHSSYLGSWLWHIPTRLGRSEALDHAALSLGLVYFSQNGSGDLKHAAQRTYGTALRSLRLSLIHTKTTIPGPEILAATLLLGYYETIIHVPHAWIRHTGGAARLLEIRGARSCYSSAFEYSMYLACRGNLISEALHSGKSTFLDGPDWDAITPDVIQFPLMPSAADGLSHEFFSLAAKLARVLHHGSSDVVKHDAALLEETLSMKASFDKWYAQYTRHDNNLRCPVTSYGAHGVGRDPACHRIIYHDTASATMITTHYAYLILLNRQILKLRWDEKEAVYLPQESEYLARSVCMSIPYCLEAGFCGISTLKMVLPIIQADVPNECSEWFTSVVEKNNLI